MYKKSHPYLLLIALLALQISCASKKTIEVNETINEAIPPKLIFLNYTISKDANGNKHIQFINKIITDGKLKNNTETYLKTSAVGDLKCTQLDKDSIEIKTVIIENPLSKIIEYVNDSLIFESKKIELNRAPLSLRLALHDKTKYIIISDIIDSLQNSRPLITTKLD
ncbi:hypothetical protein [Confluentibacter flavum]|uniref:Lipoprotein n=1 Tax=Confluentibacter flavum TaxID=1909700 RepID=A0A2N3HEW1_9FLAO|nr:hypothetical protein [Confluentibacter flavum]PKQ43517.1 hypothetical protein CSW08_17755 [Confluentibacter flavum]